MKDYVVYIKNFKTDESGMRYDLWARGDSLKAIMKSATYIINDPRHLAGWLTADLKAIKYIKVRYLSDLRSSIEKRIIYE